MTVKGKKERSLKQIHRDVLKMFSKSSCIELLNFTTLIFLHQQKICADSKLPININVYGKGNQKVVTNHFPKIPLVVLPLVVLILYICITCHLCVSCIFRVKRARKETRDPKGTTEVLANVLYR